MKHYLSFLVLLCPFIGACQDVLLRGKITGTDAEPIPGATVIAKGSGRHTVTDHRGLFTLAGLAGPDTLRISAVGFTARELPTDGRTPLTVALERSTTTLREVTVSTGYQTLPRERATGSFTHIDRTTLHQQVSPGLLERLEAVAPSVLVDRKTNGGGLMVRGLSTINGNKAPLVVVDHFPYEGDLNNINPQDVESVTILRDAAAASIWGTRAGNGVIVITTRKGAYNRPLSLEFSSATTLTARPDLYYPSQMTSEDFIAVEQFLFSKGYYRSRLNSPARPALSPVVEILQAQATGALTPDEAAARIQALKEEDVRRDFDRYLYRQGLHQQYALSLRGGSDRHAWTLSGGHDASASVLDERYRRLTLRLEDRLKLAPRLELTAGLQVTSGRSAAGRPGMGQVSAYMNNLYPYAQLAGPGGEPLSIIKEYRASYLDTAGGGHLLDWKYYPLEDYRHTQNTTQVADLTGSGGLRYRFAGGLTAEVLYQYGRQHTQRRHLQDEGAWYTRNMINLYTQIDRGSGTLTRPVPLGGILDAESSVLASHQLRTQLHYEHRWKRHGLTLLAGAERRQAAAEGSSTRLYGYSDEVLTSTPVDETALYPTFINGVRRTIPGGAFVSSTLNRFVSFYGNGAWTYRDRYTLTASARRDASNLFGVRTNNRWTPLWSAGLAWELSRENFYPLDFLPFLKLRLTYGYSGNTDPERSALTTLSYGGTSPYTRGPVATIRNYHNPELRWEKVGTLNAGADFSAPRISGSVEYYRKRAVDLIGPAPVEQTAGLPVATVHRNVATLLSEGVDVELNTRNLSGPLGWTTHLAVSYYRDEVLDYYLDSDRGSRFVGWGQGIEPLEGRPLNAFYSYRWAGLDPATGDPRGYLEGQVSRNYPALIGPATRVSDMVYHGPKFPAVFGSVGNTLTWKGFSVTARLLYRLGHYFRAYSINYNDLFSRWKSHGDYALRWQKPGDEQTTHVPSLVYPAVSSRDGFYAGSEVTVHRADNLRLQYVTVSWERASKKDGRLPPGRFRLYVTAQDLGILWRANKVGADPDILYNTLPQPRSFAFGLRASF